MKNNIFIWTCFVLLFFSCRTTDITASCDVEKKYIKKVEYRNITFSTNDPVKKLSPEQLVQDIDWLKYYIATSYVAYYDMQKKGIYNFNKALEKLKTQCEHSDNMSQQQFALIIQQGLYGWPDGHAGLSDGIQHLNFSKHRLYYTTGVILQKCGTSYTVISSDTSEIKEGWEYIPSSLTENNLFAVYDSQGRKLYRIGILRDTPVETLSLLFRSKDQQIMQKILRVHEWLSSSDNLCNKICETESQSYIKFTKNVVQEGTDPIVDDWLKKFANYGKNAAEKKMLVIDLRQNKGGLYCYSSEFLSDFNPANDDLTNEAFWERYSPDWKHILSPAVIQYELFFIERQFASAFTPSFRKQLMTEYKNLQELNKGMQKRPRSIVTVVNNTDLSLSPMINDITFYPGNIIVITDRETRSAAEWFCLELKKARHITFIGENSAGCLLSGNPYCYVLPNSKLIVNIPQLESLAVQILPEHADSPAGFIPDYWVSSDEELYSDLRGMGVDPVLLEKIKEANK